MTALPESTFIPFELMSGLIVVDVLVNGAARRFVVDTGASHTILTAKAAAALALEPEPASQTTAQGAGSGVVAAPITVRSFTWGGLQLADLTLMRVELDSVCGLVGKEIAGVIGYDVLSRARITVDYQERRLTLEPVSSSDY